MNKKQFGIIFTLLGLIICVGLLATKLNNGGLNDPDGLSQAVARNDDCLLYTSPSPRDA